MLPVQHLPLEVISISIYTSLKPLKATQILVCQGHRSCYRRDLPKGKVSKEELNTSDWGGYEGQSIKLKEWVEIFC